MYACMCVHVNVCLSLCLYKIICMYVDVACVCMYVFMYVYYLSVCLHTCVYVCAHIHMCIVLYIIMCMLCMCTTVYECLYICDWASENGPSGHTNFDHIFHVCCIITNDLLKLYK